MTTGEILFMFFCIFIVWDMIMLCITKTSLLHSLFFALFSKDTNKENK